MLKNRFCLDKYKYKAIKWNPNFNGKYDKYVVL